MGYISEDFLKDFATRQKGYIDGKNNELKNSFGLNDIPIFSRTVSYNIGDYVMYNNNIYKTKVRHKGDWNIDDFEATNLYNEIDKLGESANENIVVILQTSDGEGDVSGVSVLFTIEGETNPIEVISDDNGRASIVVNKGLLVDIEVSGIEGYYTPAIQHIRTSLAKRNLYITYVIDKSGTYETVIINFNYNNNNNNNKADSIDVIYDEQTHTVPIVNDIAQFDVPINTVYNIIYPDVDGFRTPSPTQFTAKLVSRIHTVFYLDPSFGSFMWIMNDGSCKNIENATLEDVNDIAGMLVYAPTVCTPFIIAKEIYYNERRGMPISSTETLSSSISLYSSATLALSDVDGKNTTNLISNNSPLKTYCQSCHIYIDNIEKSGYIPSYAQIKIIKDNISNIISFFNNIGLSFPNATYISCTFSASNYSSYNINSAIVRWNLGSPDKLSVIPIFPY